MPSHASDEELIELLEGGPRSGLEHLRDCASCAARHAELETVLGAAREAEVPEPSPLYWGVFRRQVATRIDSHESQARQRRWRVAAAAAAAVAIAALAAFFGMGGPERGAPSAPPLAWSPLPPPTEDAALVVVRGALQEDDEVPEVGACGGYAGSLASLSESESAALLETLGSALAKGVS